jgi:hypothetical protein
MSPGRGVGLNLVWTFAVVVGAAQTAAVVALVGGVRRPALGFAASPDVARPRAVPLTRPRSVEVEV